MNLKASSLIASLNEVRATQPAFDSKALHVCQLMFRAGYEMAHEATQQRRAHLRRIAELAEGGQVAIVTSGMDCDCSRWDNAVYLVPATVKDVDEWLEQYYADAEGPQGAYIERPSVARLLRETHRDLVLEAFENGHPHVVYYGPSDVPGHPGEL